MELIKVRLMQQSLCYLRNLLSTSDLELGQLPGALASSFAAEGSNFFRKSAASLAALLFQLPFPGRMMLHALRPRLMPQQRRFFAGTKPSLCNSASA